MASFVIAAAASPGAAVTYCSRINPIDPRTAISSWGGPEIGMAGACATQLAHRLGLPCDSFGFCTSATRLDPQFAYERLIQRADTRAGRRRYPLRRRQHRERDGRRLRDRGDRR